jgi:hypothetical protein
MELRDCANPECGLPFIPKIHNALYCEPECRTAVMNKRILDKYHERKNAKKNRKGRVCSRVKCSNILSIYNSEDICESCKEKRLDARMLKWGYSPDIIDRYKDK